MSYRVYIAEMIRGLFEESDVDWNVLYYPDMSRKEVDDLIDSLCEEAAPVESDVSWEWIYYDNMSKVMMRKLEIISNDVSCYMTPVMWYE